MTHPFLKPLFLSTFLLGSALIGMDMDDVDPSVDPADPTATDETPTKSKLNIFSGKETTENGVNTRFIPMRPAAQKPSESLFKQIRKKAADKRTERYDFMGESIGEDVKFGINETHPEYINIQFKTLEEFVVQCQRLYSKPDQQKSVFTRQKSRLTLNAKREAKRVFVKNLCTAFGKFAGFSTGQKEKTYMLKEMFYEDLGESTMGVKFIIKSEDDQNYSWLRLLFTPEATVQYEKDSAQPINIGPHILFSKETPTLEEFKKNLIGMRIDISDTTSPDRPYYLDLFPEKPSKGPGPQKKSSKKKAAPVVPADRAAAGETP